MRKIVFWVVIGLVLTLKLEAKKIEGKIFFEHDTAEVILIIPIKFFTQEPNFEKLQYKVKYINSIGKKIVLRPDNAREVQFKFENENVRMLSRYNSLGLGSIFSSSNNIFLRLEIDGELKLFNYYYTQSSPGMYNASTGTMTGGYYYSVERYVLQKGDGELKRPKSLTFRNDMAEYFSDCPGLVERIEDKDFRKGDLKSIVKFYNTRCR